MYRLPRFISTTAYAALGTVAFSAFAQAGAQNSPDIGRNSDPSPAFYSSDAIDFEGLSRFTRTLDVLEPVARDALISISSAYGMIRVNVWDNPVARVSAEISVGAPDNELARQYADDIGVRVDAIDGNLSVVTVYPSNEYSDGGGVPMQVNYTLTIPRPARLAVANDFGDTVVTGVDGDVTLNTSFGAVELHDIGGYVRAKASRFHFIADGLHGGATVNLRMSKALFLDISGSLSVASQWESVELRDVRENADVFVISEDGPIHFYLEPASYPHIEAEAIFGVIESDLVMNRQTIGDATRASVVNTDATQRVTLATSFESIYIHEDTPESAIEPLVLSGAHRVVEETSETYPLGDGLPITVDAGPGNLSIIGVDEEMVTLTVQKYAELPPAQAAKAIENLSISVKPGPDGFHVETAALASAIDCEACGVDLVLRVPRTSPIQVSAESGTTRIADTGGNLVIDQKAGMVVVEHGKGTLDIRVERGNVTVNDCAGPVRVEGASGNAMLSTIYGEIDVTYSDGKTIIDSPNAGVRIRQARGDVRIIAPEGIFGEFDIDVNGGDISMAVPDDTDASFWMTAQGGAVYPSFAVSGTKSRDSESFQGQLNEGTHRVLLKTTDGNIVLD